MERFEHESHWKRRLWQAAAAALILVIGGYAGAKTVEWICDVIIEEKPLSGGNSEFTLKNGKGEVIDQVVLRSDTEFFAIDPEPGQEPVILGLDALEGEPEPGSTDPEGH